MTSTALETLTTALREHGNAKATWVLSGTMSDFYAAWASQIAALENTGECEIPASLTLSGQPVIVTLQVNR